jgi:hypothetical protein
MMLDLLASPNVYDSNGGSVHAGYSRKSPVWSLDVQAMAFFDSIYSHGLGRVELAFQFFGGTARWSRIAARWTTGSPAAGSRSKRFFRCIAV